MWKNVTKVLIMLLLCVSLFGCNMNKTQKVTTNTTTKPQKDVEDTTPQEIDKEKYITYNEDGVRINTSPKIINQTQTINNIEFSIRSIEEVANITTITLNVKNISDIESTEKQVTLSLYDEIGNNMLNQTLTVPSLLPEEDMNIKVQATLDYAYAYEFRIMYINE